MQFSRTRWLNRWLLAALLTAGGLLTGSPALAQQPSREEIRQFKRLMATGAKHYKAREYDQALEAFRSAEEIASPPSLKYSLGRTLQALHRCSEAEAVFQNYVSSDGLPDAKVEKGRKRLRELRRNCTPIGTLQIRCTPSDVRTMIRIADTEKTCPATFELEAGAHPVAVRAEGHRDIDITARVSGGERTTHTVTLVETGGGGVAQRRSKGDKLGWKPFAQYGGLAVGAGLIAGGLASDLGAKSRLEKLRKAEEAGDADRVQSLKQEGKTAKTRTALLYGTGAALAIGAGTWLVIDVLSKDTDSKSATAGLAVTPTSVSGFVRW